MELDVENDTAEVKSKAAAIETLAPQAPAASQPPSDPLRDLLAEDLRDTLLEKLPESMRAKLTDAVKGDNILDQIKFIKRYSKLQPAAAPITLPVGNNSNPEFDVVAFSERARKDRMEKAAKSMYK